MKTKDQKTIFMPRPALDGWLKALRTNTLNGKKIKKINSTLRDNIGGYCALGVLEHVVEPDWVGSSGLPTESFLRRHNIGFLAENGGHTPSAYLPSLGLTVSSANDTGKSFKTIADAIERHAQVIQVPKAPTKKKATKKKK